MEDKEHFIANVEYKECRSAILNFDKIYTTFLVVAVDRALAIEQKFSENLPLECTDDQFPLTKTITKAYKEKFKTISRGHWRLYIILAIMSIILTIFYYLAEVVG